VRALQEIGQIKDPEAFDVAVEIVGGWQRDERREGVKTLLQAMAERPMGRRDQASRWIWHLAEYSREVHEEYAVSRWPETKRLLGLLVNSSGGAHARNARRLVHATKKQDRRLSAALLAAALAHTPEAQQVLDGARMRLGRKPSALARELLRNFPKGKRKRAGRRRKKGGGGGANAKAAEAQQPQDAVANGDASTDAKAGAAANGGTPSDSSADAQPKKPRQRRRRAAKPKASTAEKGAKPAKAESSPAPSDSE
jgi:hypothetical protein